MMLRATAVLACLAVSAAPAAAAIRHVVVIAMENSDAARTGNAGHGYIYGNMADAPWLNGSFSASSARAVNFADALSAFDSEPHYVLMEAGTNSFADTEFRCDNDPLKSCSYIFPKPNWTTSSAHLTAQIEAAARPGLTWMTYQEDIDPRTTGACPIHSAGHYAAKHNPFVFFGDAAGAPPAADNAHCIAHTRDLGRFAADLRAGDLASYVFVSPNLCNDMHGAPGCPGNSVKAGDDFLKRFLPPLVDWATTHDAVVFVTWDEGHKGLRIPFYAAGAGVKANYEGHAAYSHRSLVKTIERIFGLPALATVNSATDLADLFVPGALP